LLSLNNAINLFSVFSKARIFVQWQQDGIYSDKKYV